MSEMKFFDGNRIDYRNFRLSQIVKLYFPPPEERMSWKRDIAVVKSATCLSHDFTKSPISAILILLLGRLACFTPSSLIIKRPECISNSVLHKSEILSTQFGSTCCLVASHVPKSRINIAE